MSVIRVRPRGRVTTGFRFERIILFTVVAFLFQLSNHFVILVDTILSGSKVCTFPMIICLVVDLSVQADPVVGWAHTSHRQSGGQHLNPSELYHHHHFVLHSVSPSFLRKVITLATLTIAKLYCVRCPG